MKANLASILDDFVIYGTSMLPQLLHLEEFPAPLYFHKLALEEQLATAARMEIDILASQF